MKGTRNVAPVLQAGFLLIVSLSICPHVAQALYNWPSKPSVTDPVYPTSGESNKAGWNLTGGWWTNSGGIVDCGGLTLTGIDLFASVLFDRKTWFVVLTFNEWDGSGLIWTTPDTSFGFTFSSWIEDGNRWKTIA